ncbi:3-hexulose-6-phosphate isomerase [Anoxybacillus vitaminiphilus]|uniref:3-hexulose-6-phosphate isomerase n=1 Tax=Paranoxybacillus vitaminiphilus TaxID=581036 RepID=A0A327YM58_9BACL|nr:6-phospho-3-hexuloisomerase [Anoxybacillus vitaminiphilus]RAK22073.1 3-hexulose-6-phosphate isomerase [Anoxybacillus vitaminiphilus]
MIRNIVTTICDEVKTILSNIAENEALIFAERLNQAKRIFVYGEGRSGLMGKAFAMRLMHGGYEVFVVGETITPSIGYGDLLILISGSGATQSIYSFAVKAKEAGAQLGLVTTNQESKIAKISDFLLIIPAATKYRLPHEPQTIQPLGNQFDQSVHLLLDAVIIHALRSNKNKDENLNETLRQRHANLE